MSIDYNKFKKKNMLRCCLNRKGNWMHREHKIKMQWNDLRAWKKRAKSFHQHQSSESFVFVSNKFTGKMSKKLKNGYKSYY